MSRYGKGGLGAASGVMLVSYAQATGNTSSYGRIYRSNCKYFTVYVMPAH